MNVEKNILNNRINDSFLLLMNLWTPKSTMINNCKVMEMQLTLIMLHNFINLQGDVNT